MQVIPLERLTKTAPQRRLELGRQGLQVAALIAAHLPDQRDDALAVLDRAVRLVREWLDTNGESGPARALSATSDAAKRVRDDRGE